MKHILARANRDVLRQFACSRVLLAFDYDGTLAPLVSDPERAELRPATRKLLAVLTALYPCTVISGRAVRDVERRVAGIPFRSAAALKWIAISGARARPSPQ